MQNTTRTYWSGFINSKFSDRSDMSECGPYIKRKPRRRCLRGFRGGGYLLFHFRSIIGVAGFNFSVRNG